MGNLVSHLSKEDYEIFSESKKRLMDELNSLFKNYVREPTKNVGAAWMPQENGDQRFCLFFDQGAFFVDK